MNRMEDIKIKLKDSEFVAVDFTVEEVQYLLSKLDEAIAVLSLIAGEPQPVAGKMLYNPEKTAQIALQQIRE